MTGLKETSCLKYYKANTFPMYIKKYNINLLSKQHNNKDKQLSEEHTINHRVGQGCPLSPTLFNIYIHEIIVKWNHTGTKALLYQPVQK